MGIVPKTKIASASIAVPILIIDCVLSLVMIIFVVLNQFHLKIPIGEYANEWIRGLF